LLWARAEKLIPHFSLQVAIKAEKAISKTSKMEQDVQDLDEALRKQVKDSKDQGGKVALIQTDLEQVRLDFEARIARLEKIVVVLQVREGRVGCWCGGKRVSPLCAGTGWGSEGSKPGWEV
jgi:hypothetical protein